MEITTQLQQEIVSIVVDSVLRGEGIHKGIRIGPMEVNDFSICFWLDYKTNDDKKGVYIKIPKFNLFYQNSRNILPITEQDVSFATKEYESLLCLEKFWNIGSQNVRFVTPLAFIKKYNAIVTKREYATDAFVFFRKWDQQARLGLRKGEMKMKSALQELAKALSKFHTTWATTETFSTQNGIDKISRYCCKLESEGVHQSFLENVLKRLSSMGNTTFSMDITRTLKGLDLRNILMDSFGRLLLLDPGAMKQDCREADIARFLVTLKILYWGKMSFGIGMCPQPVFFDAFIEAYYGHLPHSKPLLSFFMIKELFKQWWMGHVAVSMKSWPSSLKRTMIRIYVDPFYKKQIEREIIKLEQSF